MTNAQCLALIIATLRAGDMANGDGATASLWLRAVNYIERQHERALQEKP